ncbi:hypothetical protein HanIR_Chr01g0041641 [Helianthus annuus]|nr:hypothetical protein HanIR_Chr01g0041641 [Helianthus annuus]
MFVYLFKHSIDLYLLKLDMRYVICFSYFFSNARVCFSQIEKVLSYILNID